MTDTNELRSMLDEREVKWNATDTYRLLVTSWNDASGHSWAFMEHRDGNFSKLTAYHLTPEQAIAATLGGEDTYTREDVEGAFVSGYSLGLDMFDSSKPDSEKGWNQNERNMEEEMEDLGWVRKDAATLGRGTCQLKRASWDDGTCTWGCICSACDAHLEHETGIGYNYCPICGAKVVEE